MAVTQVVWANHVTATIGATKCQCQNSLDKGQVSKLCVWEINKNNTPFAISSTTTYNNCVELYLLLHEAVWDTSFTHTLSLFHKCWYSLWNKKTQVIMITIQENSLTAADFSPVKLLIQWSLKENGVISSPYIITVKSILRRTYLPIFEHTFTQFL